MGTAVASVALGSTLALKMLLYQELNDNKMTYKAVLLEVAGGKLGGGMLG